MADEYMHKISSRYLQKWLRFNIKHVKNRHFSRHFGTLPRFSEFYFLTDFDASKNVLGPFKIPQWGAGYRYLSEKQEGWQAQAPSPTSSARVKGLSCQISGSCSFVTFRMIIYT